MSTKQEVVSRHSGQTLLDLVNAYKASRDVPLSSINYVELEEMKNVEKRILLSLVSPRRILVVLAVIIIFAAAKSFMLVLFAILGLAWYVSNETIKYKNKIWERFAKSNGWAIIDKDAMAEYVLPPGLIMYGHSPAYSPGVMAKISGHEYLVYSYDYTVGSGKSATTYFCTIVRFDIGKQMPYIILDSKQVTVGARDHGNASQKIKLEGDFNKYFTLRIIKDTQLDALSIITPDVMQTLIQSNRAQDIEIAGKYVYFVAHEDQRTTEGLRPLLASVDALADEIAHKAKTYIP